MTAKKNSQIGIYAIGVVLFLAIRYAFDFSVFSFLGEYHSFLEKLSLTLSVICMVLLIRTIIERLIEKSSQEKGVQYNLKRMTGLLTSIVIVIVAISFMFQKPYTALAGVGIISLVLGFALQAPITSFIAWLYIIFRKPYHVGNRIQIGGLRGDVIEINYLDTIILECSGDYLGNDHASGRTIHFPNSIILKDKVINYSGNLKPFIWNETAFQIAYTSDLEFVEKCLMEAAVEDFKNQYPHKSQKGFEAQVYFRPNLYSWMEAVISYPVEPTDTTGKRNRIIHLALPKMNASPDKVQFPQGASR